MRAQKSVVMFYCSLAAAIWPSAAQLVPISYHRTSQRRSRRGMPRWRRRVGAAQSVRALRGGGAACTTRLSGRTAWCCAMGVGWTRRTRLTRLRTRWSAHAPATPNSGLPRLLARGTRTQPPLGDFSRGPSSAPLATRPLWCQPRGSRSSYEDLCWAVRRLPQGRRRPGALGRPDTPS